MKTFNVLRNYFKSILISKTRFKLTIVGMSISYFLFLICILFFDTYVKHVNSNYDSFGDDLLIVDCVEGLTLEEEIFINNNFSKSKITYYTSNYNKNIIINNNEINLYITGCSRNFYDNYIYSYDIYGNQLDNNPLVQKREMLLGNTWEIQDSTNAARVLVINEYGARCFFGDVNPLGRYVEIENVTYKIIGVISNSKITEDFLRKMNHNMNYYPPIEIYMPKSTFNKHLSLANNNKVIIEGNQHSYNETIDFFNLSDFDCELYSRETVDKSISKSINTILPIIISIELFLGIISLIFMLNTMFFNLKERIPEFGIRMALGAGKTDITKQVLFEGFIYSIISLCIAVYVFLIFVLIISIFLSASTFILNRLYIDVLHFLLTIMIILIISILATFFPALYIRKMNVLSAIKFE